MFSRPFLALLVTLPALLFSCRQPAPTRRTPAQKDSVAASYYAFHPRFEIKDTTDNRALGAVLQFWKGYESGNLAPLLPLFSDTMTMSINESMYKGAASVTLQRYAAERSRMRFAQCHIDFWKVLHIAEKRENWVLLWAQREGTLHNGSLDSKSIHQIWRFNAEGKVYSLQELRGAFQW